MVTLHAVHFLNNNFKVTVDAEMKMTETVGAAIWAELIKEILKPASLLNLNQVRLSLSNAIVNFS